jgi:hypothetical protein
MLRSVFAYEPIRLAPWTTLTAADCQSVKAFTGAAAHCRHDVQ